MDCIVIKKGKYFHYTYSSIKWSRWGSPTDYPVFVCDNWQQGFQQVQQTGKKLALFVDSGTVFYDIEDFVGKIKNYPHQGLVGHIIDPQDPEKFYSLHPQCFMMDVSRFHNNLFDYDEFLAPPTERSTLNIHHDYTPLWLKPAQGKSQRQLQTDFGQKIIAHQISQNAIVSNWHQKLRDNKIFLYRNEVRDTWITYQKPYLDLAEQHLWILNNQSINLLEVEHLVSPASGLVWMISMNANQIDLVDISQHQLNLAQSLVSNWNGTDYGSFVHDFVVKNKIRHIQLDKAMTDIEKIKLISNRQNFCNYVNHKFSQQLNNLSISLKDFEQHWQQISSKKICYHRANLVDWILTTELSQNSGIWMSNILDYKYTWIKSTDQDIRQCQDRLTKIGCKVAN